MISETVFQLFLYCWLGVALITFVSLYFVTAPYGRHTQAKGWGKLIPNQWGWLFMEAPSFLIILLFWKMGNQSNYATLLSALWVFHYFNRSFVFPFRLRTKGKKMPISIVLSAVFFNAINAGTNGYYLTYFESYSMDDFYSVHFVVGAVLFVLGFVINQISDSILIGLRKPGETGYKIPHGFLYRYVSCPNFLGEIVEWTGFAIMAWNLPAWTFVIWTAANVIPRAYKHHLWYKERFSDYPKDRKVVIPFVY